MVAEHKTHQVDSLRTSLSILVDPLKYLVDLPSSLFQNTTDSLSSYSSLQAENERLRKDQLIHQTKLLRFEALEKENIRLRALLENSFKLGEQVLIAELLSVNMAPYEHTVVVNKGTRFGVHPQQPVLDAQGVVGQVFRSQPLSAEIMLITDPNHAIPVQINRNGVLTIAVGSGQLNKLNLPFLPSNADIKPGDLLITSGLGGTFPRGYPVAVVDEFVSQSDKPFANITATPTALLDRNRELMIVWSKSNPVPLVSKPNPTEAGAVSTGTAKATENTADVKASEKPAASLTETKPSEKNNKRTSDTKAAEKLGVSPTEASNPAKPKESAATTKTTASTDLSQPDTTKPAKTKKGTKPAEKPVPAPAETKKPEKPAEDTPDQLEPDEPDETHPDSEIMTDPEANPADLNPTDPEPIPDTQ